MTGMDVLRRCAGYARDMERMRVRLASCRDAMTRVTRPMDAQGHGGSGDKMGEMAARADELERGMAARREAYEMELVEALRLVGLIDSPEAAAVLYGRYVSGDTYAAIACAQRTTESAVRGSHRRGVDALNTMRSALGGQARYAALRALENRAMRPGRDPAWPGNS